jgi:ATP-binding cassette subfamily B protein
MTNTTPRKQFMTRSTRVVRYAWRSFKALAADQPAIITIYLVAAVINIASGIGSLFFVSRILQGIYTTLAHPGTTSSSKIYLSLFYSVLFTLAEQLTYRIMDIAQRRSYLRFSGKLEQIYNDKIASLDAAHFEDQSFSALLARVNTDVGYKPGNYAYQSLQVLQALLRAIIPAAILVGFAPWMVPFVLLAALPSLYAEFRLSKVSWGLWEADSKKASLHYKLSWLLRSDKTLMEVRLLGIQNFLTSNIRELLEAIASKQDKIIKRATAVLIASRIVEIAVGFGLQLWILSRVVRRTMGFTIGTFTFYSGIVSQFSNAIGLLSSSITQFLQYDLFMIDYYKVLDTKNTVVDPPNPRPIHNPFQTLEFKKVSFAYKGSEVKALDNISFTLKQGEKLAIVGANGAGKSTLIKLLLRFYYPDEGQILVDGVDLRDIAIVDWYAQIGVLFQDFNRYPFDAQTNIEIGRIEATDGHWNTAAKQADAEALVRNLPFKQKTMLDISLDDGVDLSGGQWQRIALARTFYRNAELLILDEPTAAVDAAAEFEIFENIRKSQADKTTIIISHRFSTVRNADRIIVLNKGQLAESGTHAKLLTAKGIYADMFTKQAKGYR